MPFGLSFDGMSDGNEFLRFAVEAEKLGVGSIWLLEHFCFRDSSVLASALLAATKQVEVVPGPLSPYSRHPMTIAMSASTLNELGPGRVGLMLGTGNLSAQKEFGVEVKHAVETMRESIETVRQLMGGEFVHYPGKQFTIDGAKMGFKSPNLPIYLAAIGSRMLETAGTYGDGVVLSAGLSPKFIERSLQKVNAARRASKNASLPFRRVGFIVASAAPEMREAVDTAKGLLSYLFRTPFLREDWALNGIQVDNEAILAAIKKRDWEGAKSYVGDRAVELHSITGSPVEFKRRLQSYLDAGLDLPVLIPLGTLERQKLALKLAFEVCA